MSIQSSLGLSLSRLREHEYCMTSDLLTREESELVLGKLCGLVLAEPANWHFEGNEAAYGSITVRFIGGGVCLMNPVRLNHAWSASDYPLARQLIDMLHEARHAHHNARAFQSVARALHLDMPMTEPSTTPEAEVAKLKASVARVSSREMAAMLTLWAVAVGLLVLAI